MLKPFHSLPVIPHRRARGVRKIHKEWAKYSFQRLTVMLTCLDSDGLRPSIPPDGILAKPLGWIPLYERHECQFGRAKKLVKLKGNGTSRTRYYARWATFKARIV